MLMKFYQDYDGNFFFNSEKIMINNNSDLSKFEVSEFILSNLKSRAPIIYLRCGKYITYLNV